MGPQGWINKTADPHVELRWNLAFHHQKLRPFWWRTNQTQLLQADPFVFQPPVLENPNIVSQY